MEELRALFHLARVRFRTRDWGLLPHLHHAFAEFLELVAVLEHVAGFLFAILFVDVEVDGARA